MLEKWAEPSGGGRAPETGLSLGKGDVSWCLLTSQGTTTYNRKIQLKKPPFIPKIFALKNPKITRPVLYI